MDMRILQDRNFNIYKQRNFFILLCIGSILVNVLLSVKIVVSENKLVMVPGINQEFVIGDRFVSKSYIEEISSMFLSSLLDLSPTDVGLKRDNIFKYTTESSYLDISKYFDDTIEKIKKFKISTYFTPRKFTINEKDLLVTVEGVLHTRFGDDGSEDKNVRCELSLKYTGGLLRLAKFKIDEVKQ